MNGPDVERILSVLNKLKDETAKQIEALSYVSDYRLNTIPHTHNVNISGGTHSPSPNGGHGHGDGSHVHPMDMQLQGDSPTSGIGISGKVSKPLTWPGDYSNDKHGHHSHTESSNVYEEEHPESAATYTSSIVSIGAELQQDIEKLQQIEKKMYTDKKTFHTEYGSPWTEIYTLKEKIDMIENYAKTFPALQWIGEKHTLLQLMQIVLSYSIDAKYAMDGAHDWIQRGYDCECNNNIKSLTWDSNGEKTDGNIKQNIIGNVMVALKNNDPFIIKDIITSLKSNDPF